MITEEQKEKLLELARQSIEQRFNRPAPRPPREAFYTRRKGVFVSIHKKGELRGCIGYIKGYKPLAESIIEMAQAAAFRDPRFPPVKMEELPWLELEISILGDLIPIKGPDDIQIGRDGLYIDHPDGSGLLLPQVATDWGWSAVEFFAQVCRKAGLPAESWKDEGASIYRFEAVVFSENKR